jgi:Homeodomain-like domain
LLAYREAPSFFAVGRALGLHHQTVQRCVERAAAEGPIAALDDRPRPGREPTITLEAKAWLVSLACRKAKDLGYPHELWTTRLLARHAREHGPAEGHACLANLAQGTVCKILDQEEVKPHKVRYYLEQRDPDFAEKMAEVLCVYRQVKILKQAAAVSKRKKKPSEAVAIISYDEKPGIQAIATTAPDLPTEPLALDWSGPLRQTSPRHFSRPCRRACRHHLCLPLPVCRIADAGQFNHRNESHSVALRRLPSRI